MDSKDIYSLNRLVSNDIINSFDNYIDASSAYIKSIINIPGEIIHGNGFNGFCQVASNFVNGYKSSTHLVFSLAKTVFSIFGAS